MQAIIGDLWPISKGLFVKGEEWEVQPNVVPYVKAGVRLTSYFTKPSLNKFYKAVDENTGVREDDGILMQKHFAIFVTSPVYIAGKEAELLIRLTLLALWAIGSLVYHLATGQREALKASMKKIGHAALYAAVDLIRAPYYILAMAIAAFIGVIFPKTMRVVVGDFERAMHRGKTLDEGFWLMPQHCGYRSTCRQRELTVSQKIESFVLGEIPIYVPGCFQPIEDAVLLTEDEVGSYTENRRLTAEGAAALIAKATPVAPAAPESVLESWPPPPHPQPDGLQRA